MLKKKFEKRAFWFFLFVSNAIIEKQLVHPTLPLVVSNSLDPLCCVSPIAELVNAAECIVGEVDLCTKDDSSEDRQTGQFISRKSSTCFREPLTPAFVRSDASSTASGGLRPLPL